MIQWIVKNRHSGWCFSITFVSPAPVSDKLGFQNGKKRHISILGSKPWASLEEEKEKEKGMLNDIVWAPGLIYVKYWLSSLKSWADGIVDKRIKS